MFKVLNQVDVELLADGVLETLEKIGFNCESDVILKAYENAGAQVDYKSQVAKFPRKVISEFVEKIKAEDKSLWHTHLGGENTDTMCSGFHPYHGLDQFKAPKKPFLYNSLSTFYYDDETGECRTGNKDDFIKLIKFGDSICPDRGVGHAMNLMDTMPEVEPIEAALVELEYSKKPRGVYIHDVKQIPYIEEIEDIFGIEDPYWHWMANICCNSPLKLDKVVCERVIHLAKSGIYPAKLAAMPVA
jgi:trimethylamine:corrinoid methyltransferase-like protein